MIKDIKEAGKVTLQAVIAKCDKGKTTKNMPYLSLVLEDASGTIDAKYWNVTEQQINEFKAGMVVLVKGDVIVYRNAFQFRVQSIEPLPEEDASQYVRHAPMSQEQMKEQIETWIRDMKDPVLVQMIQTILKKNEHDFYTYPAATRNHHNFVGGLAYHSISMVRLACSIQALYPWLDKDLLIAGVLMHDIGKIEEYSSPVLPEYTPKGNLLGHISIMNTVIDRTAHELGLQEEESVLLLEHMVLSHHGKTEFGSPVVPMIPEAEVLSTIDNLDARLFMMKESLEKTMPGAFGPRVFALENRMIYKRKKEEE
ncbi:MAG: HD domain-containing protein [Erysipelotrichaceae bacterium]|nr:HD domain-containing protein [Erysipelotrichaceae bacterium]